MILIGKIYALMNKKIETAPGRIENQLREISGKFS